MTPACTLQYMDTVSYTIHVVDAAWRLGSVEVNSYRYGSIAQRVYNGAWIITSAPRVEELGELTVHTPVYRGRGCLAEARMYHGRACIGGEGGVEDVVRLVERVVGEGDVELVASMYHVRRAIRWPRGGEAVEDKRFTVVTLAAAAGRGAVSASVGFLGAPRSEHVVALRRIVEELKYRASLQAKAGMLNPLASGRWDVILTRDASAALLHEIGHCLQASNPSKLPRGARLHEELTIIDDPFYPGSPAARLFDDEGVEARRKTLVEDGVVREWLETRETACRTGGRPGNAVGLFHRPFPGWSTLVMKQGDWREDEVLEETRRGIMVDSVAEAWLDDKGVITIVPESAWYVERGSLTPLRVSRVRVRLRDLSSIDAIGRRRWLRVGLEKGYVVAEAAPTVRLKAYVD